MKKYSLMLLLSFLFFGCGEGGESSSSLDSTSGISGSKTKFKISGDYIYTVNGDTISILDIADASNPIPITRNTIPHHIDTIAMYENYLYVGSSNQIYVYDKTDPTNLEDPIMFNDAQSCNPIAVANGLAYVLFNIDSTCGFSSRSKLDVIDIRDISSPKLIKTEPMWSPTAVGIDNNKLFVCEGTKGIKVFDINQTENNNTISVELNRVDAKAEEINCYDLIADQNNLIISDSENILQFDYSSFPMTEMGTIK
ncbi:MAG: hypothetical protein U9P38_04785 [Campylobacterota bacterium]|nr:hypothetical protein [Campylobacterota bacterium]